MAHLVKILACVALVGALIPRDLALAASQTYTYTIEHTTHGMIGTYTNTIGQTGETTWVETRLRVLVTILGLVVHRENADRRELWRGDRLVSFQSVTTTNGDQLDVQGQAQGERFIITTLSGTILAPATVMPSNPWSLRFLKADWVMNTKTGAVSRVRVTVDGARTITVQGAAIPVRHYRIQTDKEENVWFSERGMPVAFRIIVDGSPIDFKLK
jgi:hypothetical protein